MIAKMTAPLPRLAFCFRNKYLGILSLLLFSFGLYSYVSYSIEYTRSHPKAVQPQTTPWTHRGEDVECSALYTGNKTAVAKAKKYQKRRLPFKQYSYWFYLRNTKNCTAFKKERGYVEVPITQEEENFPIAYSILVYKSLEQVERLLRSIYRPQNYYCIHVDKKSDEIFKSSLNSIAKCFQNVFVCPISVDVTWGRYTVLKADLVCMKYLLKYPKWKYFINLTGQMFPLRTNLELVHFLKSLNGTNIAIGDTKSVMPKRLKYVWTEAGKTTELNTPPPHDITIYKGPVHIAAIRDFVQFIFKDKKTLDFLEWCKHTGVPDETFFATVNNDLKLGAPGSTKEKKEFFTKGYNEVVFKLWGKRARTLGMKCYGKYVRDICIPGIRNLKMLAERQEFFLNKLFIDFNPKVFDCLEESNVKKIIKEVQMNLHAQTR